MCLNKTEKHETRSYWPTGPRVKNTNTQLHVVLKSFANSGTMHFWNLVELNNGVGNWGLPFTAWKPGWVGGDNLYGIFALQYPK